MSDNNAAKANLVVTRTFGAPLERVWKAWSDSNEVKKWWRVEGFTSSSAEVDFREGGRTLVGMGSPEYGDMYNTWTYRKIVPMERIEYISNPADKGGNKIDPVQMGLPPIPQDQLHTVTFKEVNGKTEMTVTEHNWAVGHMMEMSKQGLEQCLDRMAASFR